ncbi:MAG: hypothetical protein K0S32_4084 [Bacteroidetes bacterium]|nr:hypothetical protein [Bacteroidota bacterium]
MLSFLFLARTNSCFSYLSLATMTGFFLTVCKFQTMDYLILIGSSIILSMVIIISVGAAGLLWLRKKQNRKKNIAY